MKTEIYSWRVSVELKSDLERLARLRNTSVASVLQLAAEEWLEKAASNVDGEEEQRKLHQAAGDCIGSIRGANPGRAESARHLIRKRLERRRAS